tara:strand:+ start:2241 stop:2441 length:201 start_codon:yes stop_codon:yes gene_type:complete
MTNLEAFTVFARNVLQRSSIRTVGLKAHTVCSVMLKPFFVFTVLQFTFLKAKIKNGDIANMLVPLA